MSENKNTTAMETVEVTENTATKYTLDYVLEQIEKLHIDKEYFTTVVTEFKNILASGDDEVGTAACAKALGEAITCRETTHQQLIVFYEKMYDDLKPKPTPEPDPVNEAIERMVAEFVSQKADYVADRSHVVNAEEFESIFKEIEQVRYLREHN